MIKESTVQIKWNPKNKKYYADKGYKFTKFGESFEVPIDDLSEGSHAIITALCSDCKTELPMEYRTYLRLLENNQGKIYCRKCSCAKQAVELLATKGVCNQFQLEEVKQKSRETMRNKYGIDYISQSEKFKQEYLYGDRNNFWIDGRNSYIVTRNNSQHKQWHDELIKIYNGECFICGSDVLLECHHLYNFADNPDLAYDIENGVVLCREHHKDFHKQFGPHCTYDDFILYLAKTCRDYRKDIPFRDKG